MAAPVFQAVGSSTAAGGGGPTYFIQCPTGIAGTTDEIVVVVIYKENASTVTPAAGFTEAPNSPVVVTGTQAHNIHVFWKRPTAADTGSYGFTWTTGAWRGTAAIRFTGCVTSGDPWDTTTSAIRNTTTANTTPAVNITTTGNDRMLLWLGSTSAQTAMNTISGWTEVLDSTDGSSPGSDQSFSLAADYKTQAVAGATGSVSSTFVTNSASGAWLGALLSAAAPGQPVAAGFTGSGSLSATVTASYSSSAALAGVGALTAITAVVQISAISAALSASGALSAATSPVEAVNVPAAFTATGALTATNRNAAAQPHLIGIGLTLAVYTPQDL